MARNTIGRGTTLMMLAFLAAGTANGAGDPLKPFPSPAAGQLRFTITLEALADESLHQVELRVGKTIEVDCNKQRFMGQVRRETVEGWGYSYYVVDDIVGPASTMMACPDSSKKQAFVSVGGGPHWVRYNSKLPVVVYVPEGFHVRYRLWSAAESDEYAVER